MRSLKRQKKPNFSKTTREFNVLMQRLQRCWNGIPLCLDRALTNTKLTATQEMALRQYVNKLIKLDIPPRLQQIGNTIGEKWTKCFLEWHLEYQVRRQRAIKVK
ncbi:hypothetical protein GB937_010657 [Aspergillus fischeri]|nr:hypothetical protein GB937_010657 [Aspergillus fischeri]